MREAGGEYGTTTGRARRVGWIDLVALRYAARINSLDHLASPSSTCSPASATLKVCTRYRGADEATFDHYPVPPDRDAPRSGDYEQLPGWDEDITDCREERELPQLRATTSPTSPTSSACRSRSSASARAATR